MKEFTDDELKALARRARDIVPTVMDIEDWDDTEADQDRFRLIDATIEAPLRAEVFRVLLEQERKVMLTYTQPDKKAKWYFPFPR